MHQDYPASQREILVVDNGSTDGTAGIIRSFPGCRRIEEPRRGAAVARNRGIAESAGEILAFTDADCVASTGWLAALLDGFRAERVGGMAGEILAFPPRTAAERHAAQRRHLSPRRYLDRPIFPFAVTANLAFRREVFDRVGGFDATSPRGGESTDFCTRFFRGTGLELRFAPRAIVLHQHRATAWTLFDQHWSYGRGHAFLYVKYCDEVPWGWRQTLNVYADLGRTAGSVLAAAARAAAGRGLRDELAFAWFDFVRKLAMRLGFAREALARGHFYL